jgi:hypothetical protein
MMSSGDILASNGELHNDLRNLLAKATDSSAK